MIVRDHKKAIMMLQDSRQAYEASAAAALAVGMSAPIKPVWAPLEQGVFYPQSVNLRREELGLITSSGKITYRVGNRKTLTFEYPSPFATMTHKRVCAAFEKCGTSPSTTSAAENRCISKGNVDAAKELNDLEQQHEENLAQLKKTGIDTVALQSTLKPMDTIGPITRPGR